MRSSFHGRSTAEEVMRGIDLSGKTVVLTGCNAGLGFETLRVLTRQGAHVVAAARTLESAQKACARVGGAGGTTPLACDLSDLGSVKRAAGEIVASGRKVDRVIANAGIMMLPRLEQVYGLEKHFVVNYLGHFLLIGGVLEAMPRHGGGRIVIVASEAHRIVPGSGLDLDDLSGERFYNPMRAYGRSNTARILFARALARRLRGEGITVNSLHPGVIGDTELTRHLWPVARWSVRLFSRRMFGKTVEQGAATQCYVAAHPETAGVTGQYFSDCRVARAGRTVQSDELGERLWALSEKLVQTHSG